MSEARRGGEDAKRAKEILISKLLAPPYLVHAEQIYWVENILRYPRSAILARGGDIATVRYRYCGAVRLVVPDLSEDPRDAAYGGLPPFISVDLCPTQRRGMRSTTMPPPHLLALGRGEREG